MSASGSDGTAAGHAQAQIDERALTAGTNARFALLVVLILVSSGAMMLDVSASLSNPVGFGCAPATPDISDLGEPGNLIGVLSGILHDHLADACLARFRYAPPVWLVLAGPAAVVALARGLFLTLPWWKARHGRVIPLSAIDTDGEIGSALGRLATEAGLDQLPRVVVDPSAITAGAVVFGNNTQPVMRLDAGLLTRRTSDPVAFRAVVLHELGHVSNRDITITYATVAVWRAFLAIVLVPYVAWGAAQLVTVARTPYWPGHAPVLVRHLALPVFLTVLVYLARSEVLRLREVYADRTAIRHGADPLGWVDAVPSGPRALRRAGSAFAELWRTHPRWDLRLRSLTDPAALFGARAVPMFVTGVSSTLITASVTAYLGAYNLGYDPFASWPAFATHAVQLLAGPALITALAGVALWRAVAYDALTSRATRSGVWAGLWLGAGLATGELVIGQVTGNHWLPPRAGALVLPVLAGVAFAWWITRCAELWVNSWRGRTLRLPMLLSLTTAFLLLSAWVLWWQYEGMLFAAGVRFNPDLGLQLYEQADPVIATSHPHMTTVVNVTSMVLAGLPLWPLLIPTAVILAATSLLAWATRPADGTPPWAQGTIDVRWSAPPRPLLRQALLPGVLGGLACWATVTWVQAQLHTWPGHRFGLYLLIYEKWQIIALVVPAAGAAILASALATRHRLILALIATQTATLVGFLGLFALASTDGCLESLSILQTSCAWRPAFTWGNVGSALGIALVLASVAAFPATAITAPLRRRRHRPAPEAGAATRPVPRLGVFASCVLLVATAALVVTTRTTLVGATGRTEPLGATTPSNSQLPSSRRVRQDLLPRTDIPVPPQVATAVAAWRDQGGDRLLRRFADQWNLVYRTMRDSEHALGPGWVDFAKLRPICGNLRAIAHDAAGYPAIPDAQAQQHWQQVIELAETGGSLCEQVGEDPHDTRAPQSVQALGAALGHTTAVLNRLNTMS
ncbi:hypothetical protein Lfu02_39930 [Longispora fulva]|uniref:Zn-dependent protease with chaperone function n=1 Tax=Longispora fulva TaxID=619741 RepID=A0A8J7GPC2_9ACTN|nr:M56 family metallopeptidase [Longispora fulva]MBG6136454.1 Zn-dependent protease with chaperone function [Longispora fulva]GIG59621.1 hypothetical protein Lfu02_39930 [Longispora fulva]